MQYMECIEPCAVLEFNSHLLSFYGEVSNQTHGSNELMYSWKIILNQDQRTLIPSIEISSGALKLLSAMEIYYLKHT